MYKQSIIYRPLYFSWYPSTLLSRSDFCLPPPGTELDFRLKYTLFANFHVSAPAKNKTVPTRTIPHSHVMPVCRKTFLFITGIYRSGTTMTNPEIFAQNKNGFCQISRHHCGMILEDVDDGRMLKNERRMSTISQARKRTNHVKHAKVVARARNTNSHPS